MRFLALLPLAGLASAQMPFPVMTKSVATSVYNEYVSQVSTYLTAQYNAPAYTSASLLLENSNEELSEEVDGDPIALAQDFLTATATPAWYSELPTGLQSYVYSVAAAEATMAAKDTGDAPKRAVWAWGAAAVAGAVGIMLL